MIVGLCLFVLLLFLAVESWGLHSWRKAVPVRVHVHGTRGKSSITRELARILREQGWRVLAKTTGDAPEYILPDGSIKSIRRMGPARIQEHVRILRMAARWKADALVVEGMALQPENIWQSEQILQATHAVIANVRPDHEESMGEGRLGVARTLGLMIPEGGRLFTAQEEGAVLLEECARRRNCVFVPVKTHGPDAQAGELARAVAGDILGRTAEAAEPVPSRRTGRFVWQGMPVVWYDFFSANDVVSSNVLWQQIPEQDDSLNVALLATRADRPLRTRAFVDWLLEDTSFDLVQVVGDHAGYAFLRALRKNRGRKGNVFWRPLLSKRQVLDHLYREAGIRGQKRLVFAGLGNFHGGGERWRAFWNSLEGSSC